MTTFAIAHLQLLREGRVPDAVAAERLRICATCEHYKDGHCRACGCPDWPISKMDRPGKIEPGKAWFPMACPQGKFPYHAGRRKLAKEFA